MSTVKYSLNGKYFKSFGVHVENSKGLLDKLKPRERQSYTWAEYHGKQLDLSAPKYEARDIVLTCWLRGDNIQSVTEQYNTFLCEFDKSGVQRLLVEPFGYKPFVFDVIITDKSELDKEFRDGEMFGKFTLTIQEPNPIKKILYTSNSNLQLSFNSDSWQDLSIDGKVQAVRGVVSFNKELLNREVVGATGNFLLGSSCQGGNHPATNMYNSEIVIQNGGVFPNVKSFYSIASSSDGGDFKMPFVESGRLSILKGKEITVSFYAKSNYPPASYKVSNHTIGQLWNIGTSGSGDKNGKRLSKEWQRFEITCIPYWGVTFEASNYVLFSAPQVELGSTVSAWKVSEAEKHYIIIAGNIEDITGLTTNAEVLWEKI